MTTYHQPSQCSTPLGIEGVAPARSSRSGPRPCTNAQRLAASKVERSADDEPHLQVIQCSTPFGVEGESGFRTRIAARSMYSCSTPFGIEGKVDQRSNFRRRARRMCSTPFGIEGGSSETCSNMAMPVSQLGAQRLSASKGEAGQTRRCHLVSLVLNAFRHRRGKQSWFCNLIHRCNFRFRLSSTGRQWPDDAKSTSLCHCRIVTTAVPSTSVPIKDLTNLSKNPFIRLRNSLTPLHDFGDQPRWRCLNGQSN